MLVGKKINIAQLCIFMVIIFASFDVFLAVDICGYTFRIAQIFLIIALGMFAISIIRGNKVIISKESIPLLVWICLQGVFIFNSPSFKNAFLYFLWLLLDAAIIVIIQHFFSSKDGMAILFKVYMMSFYILSLVGMVQWILAMIGIPIFIEMGTFGKFPRINGFCFEPSYYATYILPGWIISSYLLENGSEIIKKSFVRRCFIATTIAMIISTSRMGWLCMGLWIVFRFITMSKLFITKKLDKQKKVIFLMGIILIIALVIILAIWSRFYDLNVFFQGIGINGTSSHSSSKRIFQFKRTLALFEDSPFIGYSLGGVDAAYALKYGLKLESGLAMCVWAEVLVASGVVGTLVFLWWFIKLFLSLRGKIVSVETKSIIYAFLGECFILSFNQNILRIYFWVLLGMMNLFIYNCKKG